MAFDSTAQLGPGDWNIASDVYAHDLTANETTLISRPAYDSRPSTQPSVSEDGRYVLFHSAIANFVEPWNWPYESANDPDSKRLFVFDRVEMTTRLASLGSWGGVTRFPVYEGSISGDGSTISFVSSDLDADPP